MKKIYSIFTILLAAIAVSGCLNHEDESGFTPEKPVISFTQESVSVEKGGGEITITLESNLPWRIKSDAAWVSLAANNGLEGGEIKATVARNRLREERTATLTAWVTEDSKATISVIQAPAEATESITYHVKVDGDGLASGASWEEATTLPTALDAAGDGDVILLAAGTYTPTTLITGGTTPEERTFEIHSNFTIEGGYPANATTGAVADPANETILNGKSEVFHTVVVSAPAAETGKVILRNLTVTGGKTHTTNEEKTVYVGESLFDHGQGGGMYIGIGSKVEMENCRVAENEAFNCSGVHILPNADVTMRGCTITANSSSGNCGGIWNQGATLKMYDCTISDNSANIGGGLYSIDHKMKYKSINRLYNCTISGNRVKQYGGGTYLRARTDAVFVNCTFTGNVASKKGGALMTNGESGTTNVYAVLINSTVTKNKVEDDAVWGGGLFQHNMLSDIKCYNSIITGNTANKDAISDISKDSDVTVDILSYKSVVGSSVTSDEATTVSDLQFKAGTMLGAFDLYGTGKTKCFPLVGADNPATTNGYSASALSTLFENYTPFDAAAYRAIESDYFNVDQTGASREGTTSMGSCLSR